MPRDHPIVVSRILQPVGLVLAASIVFEAMAQRVPTLPGAWPLTGQPQSQEQVPLPDRSIESPTAGGSALLPGMDVSAGYLFEGSDPGVVRDSEAIRPTDRARPREANDQPRAVPGMTLTVPLGR
jgi:hypothetical protein